MSSGLDVRNWGSSGECSRLVAKAGVNYASVVYLPTVFIHYSFILADIGFLSCARKVMGYSRI